MDLANLMELWTAAGEVLHLPAELIMIGTVFFLRKRVENLEVRCNELEAPKTVHMVIPATA